MNEQNQHDDIETYVKGHPSSRAAVRARYGRTIDHITVAPESVDAETISFDKPDVETDKDDTGHDAVRLVDNVTARKQAKNKLAAARKAFDDKSLLKEPKAPEQKLVAANDNEPAENWLLMEAINRIKDAGTRTRRKDTALYLRELFDTVGTDALGLSVHRPGRPPSADYDMQRSESGKVIYEAGQTLDRKWRVYGEKNGESDAKRYDGFVRSVKRLAPVSDGFNPSRDDLFAQQRLDAITELEDLAAVVGPLWLPLMNAIVHNVGFTGVAAQFGYAQPVVGSFAVMLALDVAARHIEAYRDAKDFRDFVETNGLPVTARRYQRALQTSVAA